MPREQFPPPVGLPFQGQQQHQQQQQQLGAELTQRANMERRRPLPGTSQQQRGGLFAAVIARPMRFFGRGIGATATGMSTVVHSPVRAARSLRRSDAPELKSEPAPAPTQPTNRKRAPWEGLMEGVKDRLEDAQQLMPRGQATSMQVLRRCWPARLAREGGAGAAAFMGTTHDLASTGGRMFGIARLHVKIYDFALYFDAKQARQSKLSKSSSSWLPTVQPQLQPPEAAQPPTAPHQQPDFARALIGSPDIDMSLMVRASRNLPLGLMMAEYERILKRRLRAVGGSPDDPALHEMLQAFKQERLPEGVVRGGQVQKGAVLAFTKSAGGKVTAEADGTELVTVTSPDFAAAVFDLYVGATPVSADARTNALHAAARMMAFPESYTPAFGQPGVCSSAAGMACERQPLWQPWLRIFHPQPT